MPSSCGNYSKKIMSACRRCLLVTVRSIQITCALMVIMFGAWTNHIITGVRNDIDELLDEVDSDFSVDKVQDFFDALLQTPKRVWFGLAAGVWALAAIIFVVVYRKYAKSASRAILIGVELVTCLIMLGAFISITTFAVQILPMCIVVDMIPPLAAVVRVCPISKAWIFALALGLFLFIVTLIGIIVQECCGGRRKREKAAAATEMATTAYAPKSDDQYQVTTAESMNLPILQPQQSYLGQQQQNYEGGYTSASTPELQYPRNPIQPEGYPPVQQTQNPQLV